MTNRVEAIERAVVTSGYRLTVARQAIIETLVECDGHITADDLVSLVRTKKPRIGRMTVYRTLELLSELAVIRPIYQGTGAAHYILMTGGSHHHLICSRCHGVIEFDDCWASGLAESLGRRFNFQPQGHLLEVHGLCEACRR